MRPTKLAVTEHGMPIPEPATISLIAVGLALVRLGCHGFSARS
jgi:hypothetical protein